MNDILITNFGGISPLRVAAVDAIGLGNLVVLSRHGLSRYFEHAMTPQQARDMAAALVQMADSFDEVAA